MSIFLPSIGLGLLGGASSSPGAFSLVSGVANGAYTGYPQAVVKGNSSFICAVKNDGSQWIYEADNASGSLLNSLQLSSAYVIQDDHLNPAVIVTPGGALLTAYCGHNTDSVMRFRRSSAGTIAGFGAEYTQATGGATTYPQLFAHAATGNLYLIYRSTPTQWAIMKSTDDGLTWSVLGSFITDAQQMYCTGYWSGTNTLRLFSNFNQTFDNSIIYVAELNVTTGALVSGSGTLCNMLTNSPPFPSAMVNWSVLVTPGTGKAAAIQSVDLNGNLAYAVITNDQQFEEYWYAYYNGGGVFIAANWTFTKIVDGQYGVGDTSVGAYRWSGRHTMSYESGLTYPRCYISRQVRGTWYIERFDATDAAGTSWTCTMFFDSLALGLSNALQRPQGIFGASSALPFFYMNGAYHEYTSFSTGIKWPIITAQGSAFPNMTSSTSFTTPEQVALEINMTASEPVGWRVVGGADAALFFCSGNKLYLQAKQYLSPADANADNVYEVTIRATTISGKARDFSLTVAVTQAAYAPSNLIKFSQVFTNAAWTATGLTLTQNTSDILDPLGTSLACKAVQTATTVVHRVQQTVMLTAGQTYTNSCYFHAGTIGYCALNAFDTVTSFGATFDIGRSQLIAPKDSGGTLIGHGIQSVANGWLRMWLTFVAGVTSASSISQIITKGIAGSAQSELGATANNSYIFGSQLNTGALGDYAVRTT